ncbi:hypothetical protein C7H19_12910 [Aphanothece hegewaldii CCALA 016]|uniref:Uncharacterized protein n=1 Tax=Aphanothece hegewaldii CCALA 016 TaxID=2107694 RepID=A0A2T1LWN9_9CHRO|nr:hypothetical protein [Aphanothece hegewaldii]PSF36575.1 hypothetical protein C7H19_12910 [Aphanothece hegewaldii CCALA 016]
MKLIKGIILGILIILTFFTSSAYASFCRNYHEQLVCILSIKRSAKNYWEYRASISVNNIVRPIEIYDCRQKIRIQQKGVSIPFKINDPGELICSFFKK